MAFGGLALGQVNHQIKLPANVCPKYRISSECLYMRHHSVYVIDHLQGKCKLLSSGQINILLLIKAGDPHTKLQWLLYLVDHGCYCMIFDTSRCDTFKNV